mgnify:CR=1 FL=1
MKSPNLIWPLCQRISGSRRRAPIATSHEELKKISEHGGHLGECTVLLSVHVISSQYNLYVGKYSTAGGVCSSPAQCQLFRFNTISIWFFGIIGLARTSQKYQQASTPRDWQKFQNLYWYLKITNSGQYLSLTSMFSVNWYWIKPIFVINAECSLNVDSTYWVIVRQ